MLQEDATEELFVSVNSYQLEEMGFYTSRACSSVFGEGVGENERVKEKQS